jgi:uncharacterized protein YjbI with pentapeptide repeats
MANEEHLAILRQGVEVWNRWRAENPDVTPNLARADLRETNLREANLRMADLTGVIFSWADLRMADLTGANLANADLRQAGLGRIEFYRANFAGAYVADADLTGANLREAMLQRAQFYGANLFQATLQRADLREANLQEASLFGADFQNANLTRANLRNTNLSMADLTGANLQEVNLKGAVCQRATFAQANLARANLQGASLIQANLDHTILTRSQVYGLSVWDIAGTPQDQSSLIITPPDAPIVTVDDLEVAQFIYLLLNREKLRNVINTITSKAVLILGRFTPERKVVLDAMADELRKYNLLPIIFDFEGADARDFTETIKTLAGLSLFVIVDITNPKSAPLELQATVPDYQIPFIAIMQKGERPFSMFSGLRKYPWMYEKVITYSSVEGLLQGFKQKTIDRAWAIRKQLIKQKVRELETESFEDFVQGDEGSLQE